MARVSVSVRVSVRIRVRVYPFIYSLESENPLSNTQRTSNKRARKIYSALG